MGFSRIKSGRMVGRESGANVCFVEYGRQEEGVAEY